MLSKYYGSVCLQNRLIIPFMMEAPVLVLLTWMRYCKKQVISMKKSLITLFTLKPGLCHVTKAQQQINQRHEYEGLYSDCAMNCETLCENTQNNVVRGTLTNANGNTTASGYMYNVPPTLDSIDEDTATYSALRPAEFNQTGLLNNTVSEDEYSCLQHK